MIYFGESVSGVLLKVKSHTRVRPFKWRWDSFTCTQKESLHERKSPSFHEYGCDEWKWCSTCTWPGVALWVRRRRRRRRSRWRRSIAIWPGRCFVNSIVCRAISFWIFQFRHNMSSKHRKRPDWYAHYGFTCIKERDMYGIWKKKKNPFNLSNSGGFSISTKVKNCCSKPLASANRGCSHAQILLTLSEMHSSRLPPRAIAGAWTPPVPPQRNNTIISDANHCARDEEQRVAIKRLIFQSQRTHRTCLVMMTL